MNNLPKVVTQQRRGRASNPRLIDRKSDALPLSHRATRGSNSESKTGEVIVKDAAFHSEQEVYLEGTDTKEIYMKMKDRIIEN